MIPDIFTQKYRPMVWSEFCICHSHVQNEEALPSIHGATGFQVSPLRVPGRPPRPLRPPRLCEFVADVQLHFVPGIWDVTHLLIWKILMRQPVPAELASMPMRQLGHSGSTSLKLT